MSGKKIAEVSLVVFFLCAVLAVFVVYYMHSDAARAEEIGAYLNYKYGVTVDENEGVNIEGNEFSLVTSITAIIHSSSVLFSDAAGISASSRFCSSL